MRCVGPRRPRHCSASCIVKVRGKRRARGPPDIHMRGSRSCSYSFPESFSKPRGCLALDLTRLGRPALDEDPARLAAPRRSCTREALHCSTVPSSAYLSEMRRDRHDRSGGHDLRTGIGVVRGKREARPCQCRRTARRLRGTARRSYSPSRDGSASANRVHGMARRCEYTLRTVLDNASIGD